MGKGVCRFLFSAFLFSFLQLEARDIAPWGKDAPLVETSALLRMRNRQEGQPQGLSSCSGMQNSSLLQQAAISAIWFHKKVISPADGPRSHFRPNSSQYTIDAMEKYGFWKGYLLGCDRLMRENPESWIYRTLLVDNHWITKWDPVR